MVVTNKNKNKESISVFITAIKTLRVPYPGFSGDFILKTVCRWVDLFNHLGAYIQLIKKITLTSLNRTIFHLNSQAYSLNMLQIFFESEKFLKKGLSILDICINLNIFIPHYCFHYELSIAGNCRMCLIEVDTAQKPVASCAINVRPNIKIKTNSFIVKRAREGILEFLLINHPLDCPVCDQGGECDLQDEALIYGNDRGRFYNNIDFKKSVRDFIFNPMVKVQLTRCILCTRCVRFLNEVASISTVGLIGRGMQSEIGLYKDGKSVITELGSTVTDFCPVGALTVKPYALEYRAWDELYIESIDLSDSLCSSIRVYSDLKKITRILPQYNTDLEVNWIHDKTRHLTDGLVNKQLGYPLYREFTLIWKNIDVVYPKKIRESNIKFIRTSWKNISFRISAIFKVCYTNKFNSFKIKTFLGDYLDLFTLLKLKELSLVHGTNEIFNLSEKVLHGRTELVNEDFDGNYLFQINDFSKFKNFFLINVNLRIENPVLNSKLRQKVLWDKQARVFYLGAVNQLTYKYVHLGTTTKIFLKFIEGRHYYFNFLKKDLFNDNVIKPNLLIYSSELKKNYKNSCYRVFFNSLRELNKFFVIVYLAKGASSTASLDLSVDRFNISQKRFDTSCEKTTEDFCNYFIGCNEFLLNSVTFLNMYNHQMSIYQHYSGDNYFNFVDFFLPSYSHYESEKEFYINCFGILRLTKRNFFNITQEVRDNNEITKFVYNNINKNILKKDFSTSIGNTVELVYLRKQRDFNKKILKKFTKILQKIDRRNIIDLDLKKKNKFVLYTKVRELISKLPSRKIVSIKNRIDLANYVDCLVFCLFKKLLNVSSVKDFYLYKKNFLRVNYYLSYNYIDLYLKRKKFLLGFHIPYICFKERIIAISINRLKMKVSIYFNKVIFNFEKSGLSFEDYQFNNNFEKKIVLTHMSKNFNKYKNDYTNYVTKLSNVDSYKCVNNDYFRRNEVLANTYFELFELDKVLLKFQVYFNYLLSLGLFRVNRPTLFIYFKSRLTVIPSNLYKNFSFKQVKAHKNFLKRNYTNYLKSEDFKKLYDIVCTTNVNKLTLLFSKVFTVTENTEYTYENSESNEDFYDFTHHEKLFNANLLFYDDAQTYKEECYLVYKKLISLLTKSLFISGTSYNEINDVKFRKIAHKNAIVSFEKKKKYLAKINPITSYLPIHLYDKQRFKFFCITEINFYVSFVHFYVISYKVRNFYKKDLLSYYSKNMCIMSTLNFKHRSNFKL